MTTCLAWASSPAIGNARRSGALAAGGGYGARSDLMTVPVRTCVADKSLRIDALGRLLVVVHTQRGDRTRLISARKASPGESEQYHA